MQTSVNMVAARTLWNEYKRDNILNMCSSMILHQLLKNGIVLQKNNNEITPSPEIKDTFDEYWHTFIHDVLHSAICLGFVVVTILTDDVKRKYPSVVYPHLYNMRINIDQNKYEYFLDSAFVDPDNTHIYTHFGSHPLPNGEITSIVTRVLGKCLFLRKLRHTTMLMEKNKTDPGYFAEVHDTSNKERTEGIDFDFYADMNDQNDAQDHQFERNKKNIDILLKQQEIYQTLQGANSKSSLTLKNVTQLPDGQRIVPTSQNTGRQDITQMHKIMQEEICSGMGVPRSLMIGDSMYKNDTEGVTEMFKHTITFWKTTIGSLCTDIYQKIYVNTKKLKIKKNIYLAKQRHQIVVKFPVVPYIQMEQLDYLYKSGILNWENYSKLSLQACGLPEHMRVLTEPSHEIDVADVVPSDTKRKRTAR
tara:strand:- start:830 stop:2086 length:1257 start_codon:yes stop_codon:yes gene_type:complete